MKDVPGFQYRDGVLHADDVPVPAIAEATGTPTYIYSATAIRNAYRRLETAFAPLRVKFQYAVKASPNIHLCRLMHELGAGMDVVSGGELDRAWYAGAPTRDMVFAGVGKTDDEIKSALDGRFHQLHGLPDLAARCIEVDQCSDSLGVNWACRAGARDFARARAQVGMWVIKGARSAIRARFSREV